MKTSGRLPVLLGLIGAAMACYLIGFVLGAVVFLVAGAILEMSFWVRLFLSLIHISEPTRPY